MPPRDDGSLTVAESDRDQAPRHLGDASRALVEHLAERLAAGRPSRLVMDRIDAFRALGDEARWAELPSIYLLLEHHLLLGDPPLADSRGALLGVVRDTAPETLEHLRFALVFEREDRQEILLCREFLGPAIDETMAHLPDGDPVLPRLRRWLARQPEDPENPQSPEGGRASSTWSALFGRLGIDLFERCVDLLGEDEARAIFERRYRAMADLYLELPTFPVLARLFPPDELDETKLTLLSRAQTRRVLMDRLEDLQSAHGELQERHADLEMALGVLEGTNVALEQRVAERTEALERTLGELRSSEERFRRIAGGAQDAILMVDHAGVVSYTNEAAERMFGYRGDDDLVGRVLFETLVPERYHRRFEALFDRALRTGAGPGIGATTEFGARHRDGHELPVELSLSSVSIGGRWNLIGIVRDISRRKREEEERRRLDERIREAQHLESLGVLTGGIAHEFNNLLTTIVGNAGLMESTLPVDLPQRQNLEELHRAARRAAELTQQMLAYSGRGRLVVQRVDLRGLVSGMRPLLQASLSKKARLELRFAGDLAAVEADPSQLRQAVLNLATNASESLGERGGTIHIRLYELWVDRPRLDRMQLGGERVAGRYVCLELADDGEGMEPDTVAKIFEPFFSTRFLGRGLGLAAVLGIVRAHGGALEVETDPGAGTTMRVLLPTAADSESTTSAGGQRHPSSDESLAGWRGEGTILVVDDEDAVRLVARKVLEEFGFEVVTAADGAQGVEAFLQRLDADEPFDLVLLDLTMPNMDGEEALRAIRARAPESNVLLCSGYDLQDTLSRLGPDDAGPGAAGVGFVQKPYEVEALVRAVRDALGP